MDDADDEFLYGDSSAPAAAPPAPVSTGLSGDDVLDFELDGESNFGALGTGSCCTFPYPNVNPFVFLLMIVCFR